MSTSPGSDPQPPSFGDYDEEAPTEIDGDRDPPTRSRTTRIVSREEASAQGYTPPPKPTPKKKTSDDDGGKDRRVAIVLGVVILAFAGVLLWWIGSGEPEPTPEEIAAAEQAKLEAEKPRRRTIAVAPPVLRSIPDLQRSLGSSYRLSQCGKVAEEAGQSLDDTTRWARVTVDKAGAVLGVEMQDEELAGTPLAECIRSAVSTLTFPEGRVTQTVRFPISR